MMNPHNSLQDLSPTPKTCSNSCPSSQWCYPTISSSVVPFSFRLQSFQGSFPRSQFFSSGGQSIGASASASVLSMNIQGWFPLGWAGLISLVPKWLSKVFPKNHSLKASTLQHSGFFMVQLSHPYMTTGKTIALTRRTFVGKVMSLLFNTLSGLIPVRIDWFHLLAVGLSRVFSNTTVWKHQFFYFNLHFPND